MAASVIKVAEYRALTQNDLSNVSASYSITGVAGYKYGKHVHLEVKGSVPTGTILRDMKFFKAPNIIPAQGSSKRVGMFILNGYAYATLAILTDDGSITQGATQATTSGTAIVDFVIDTIV